jgi:ectoine hydroxylase-related dioxygenase (phytanoyl-CoA dioxygenase family)
MWGLDRIPTVQIWIAIDDAPPESGPLEIMSRTHALGLATPLGGRVPPEIVNARGDPSRVVELPAAAGEAILLHNLVWHRSGTNGTAQPRRAMSIAYIPANTRCLRKKRAPRTFYSVWL